MKKTKLIAVLFISLCAAAYQACLTGSPLGEAEGRQAYCEEAPPAPEALTQQIIEAKDREGAYQLLEKTKDFYFANNQYNEFVGFLNSLRAKKQDLAPAINYYTGLARYSQLKQLEEAQQWNEYFNQGDFYRGQLTESLEKAIAGTSYLDEINLYALLTLWRYYRDRDGPLSAAVLSELVEGVLEYSKIKSDPSPVKKVADTLLSYGERPKAKELYAVYVKKIAAGNINAGQLKQAADDFYKEGSLELSEALYGLYLERIPPGNKQKLISELKNTAMRFVYQDNLPCDPLYAEKIFKMIEETGTKKVFTEDLIYLRAFNLEKMKDFPAARDYYLDLIAGYPFGNHFDEACYKAGIITTYISGEINSGRGLFGKLINKRAPLSPQSASGYYQLGLLAQWDGQPAVAREYYSKLIAQAAGGFSDTLTLAQARLTEIEAQKPIEYNLKTFLDAALKKHFLPQQMRSADLLCRPYRPRTGEEVNLETTTHPAQSGCIPVALSYLWSGHIGTEGFSGRSESLKVSYNLPGTKEINLIILSPAGIVEYAMDLIDVYPVKDVTP